ncbi:MAG: histidinol-phosphatase [Tannerellaceae bacterium]|nr:histidinol-phosphatase [Tannerellaceae bacterium]
MHLSNYHSHCTFCNGRSGPEDFIKFALAKGFRAYGFSSHASLPFETFWNMSAADVPEYLAEIGRPKEKYKGQIEIYTGMEIDYLDETYHPSISYFRELPLDYRIGSIHFLPVSPLLSEENMVCIDGRFADMREGIEQHFEGDVRNLVRHYFDSGMHMVEAGGMDIVGHIDKVYMNCSRYEIFSLEADWYLQPFRDLLQLIAEKGLMVEINTKNMSRKKQTFPHLQFLPLLKELGIPVLVNSDCHFPDLVNDGRKEAFILLKEAGFRTTRELVNGQWEDVPLS